MRKKGNDLSKNERQELVLTILEAYANQSPGLSTTDIFDLLNSKCPGVTKRTLYRDLDELSLRYCLTTGSENGKSMWILMKGHEDRLRSNLFREFYQKSILFVLGIEDEVKV